jgi:hypothetical protein
MIMYLSNGSYAIQKTAAILGKRVFISLGHMWAQDFPGGTKESRKFPNISPPGVTFD